MKKKPIKALIFDLGGVIMHAGYLDFIRHCVGKHLPKAKKRTIGRLEHQFNLGTITEREWSNSLQKELKVHLTQKQIHNQIIAGMKTNKALVKYIKTLKKSKIALFSNSLGEIVGETLKRGHIGGHKLFDRLYLSSVIHLAKPSKNSYLFVVHSLKVKPHEALMIDDRLENITAAKKAGMQGIVFKNLGQFKKQLKSYQLT